jgi:hypothetical protein
LLLQTQKAATESENLVQAALIAQLESDTAQLRAELPGSQREVLAVVTVSPNDQQAAAVNRPSVLEQALSELTTRGAALEKELAEMRERLVATEREKAEFDKKKEALAANERPSAQDGTAAAAVRKRRPRTEDSTERQRLASGGAPGKGGRAIEGGRGASRTSGETVFPKSPAPSQGSERREAMRL